MEIKGLKREEEGRRNGRRRRKEGKGGKKDLKNVNREEGVEVWKRKSDRGTETERRESEW